MSLSKLKRLHIIIIGSVLCVIAGVALFFLVIKPQKEAYKAAEARYQAASVKGNQSSLMDAQRKLAQAYIAQATAQRTLDAEMRRCMPDLSFANRTTGMLALWNEQIKTLGPLLESFARDKTVTVQGASFAIPPPPANPNDAIFDQDVLVFPLGTINAEGNFKNLMANITRWNNCTRLVMVSPPTLQGTSPRLASSYSLTCYIFPVAKGGTKVPMAGAGGQQQMAGGL